MQSYICVWLCSYTDRGLVVKCTASQQVLNLQFKHLPPPRFDLHKLIFKGVSIYYWDMDKSSSSGLASSGASSMDTFPKGFPLHLP